MSLRIAGGRQCGVMSAQSAVHQVKFGMGSEQLFSSHKTLVRWPRVQFLDHQAQGTRSGGDVNAVQRHHRELGTNKNTNPLDAAGLEHTKHEPQLEHMEYEPSSCNWNTRNTHPGCKLPIKVLDKGVALASPVLNTERNNALGGTYCNGLEMVLALLAILTPT